MRLVFGVVIAVGSGGCLGLGGGGDDDDDSSEEEDDDGGGGGLGLGDDDEDDDDDDGNGGGNNQVCALGVEAFCFCSDYYGYTCTRPETQDYLELCATGDDYGVFECFESYVDAGYIDCYAAITDCLDY